MFSLFNASIQTHFHISHFVRHALLVLFIALPFNARAEPDLSNLINIIAATPEGEWVQVNQNQFQETWTPAELRPLAYTSNPTPEKIIAAWASFAWDSTRGDLIIYGGGHGNYAGNDVYRWRGTTLQWERASLPSEVSTDTAGQDVTVDGPDHSPVSAHTYDNNLYLPILDRFLTFGGAKFEQSGPYTRDRGDGTARPTGPYTFDPSKADGNKVGGLTGSHVMRESPHPEIVGGEMWQNRDIYGNLGIAEGLPSSFIDGSTDVTSKSGVDVVYVTAPVNLSSIQYLFKYTVNSATSPELDQWEKVGIEFEAFNGQGAGAIDDNLNLFVRTANGRITYWDLSTPGAANRNKIINPSSIGGEFLLNANYGMDYDNTRDQFLLWAGGGEVWALKSPGYASPVGWTVTKQPTPFLATPSTVIGAGVLGKWKYIEQLDAYIGLVDPAQGNIWIYKPVGWQNPNGGNSTPSALRILTTSLNNATKNTFYSYNLAGAGGTTPYYWTLFSGSLPDGLVLNSAGTLSGTPLFQGNFTFTVQAMDDLGETATQDLALTVDEPSTYLFEDNFSDGNIAPWAQLKSGQIKLVTDPSEGWVLRKTSLDDPNGGWAPLGRSIGDFDMLIYTRKVNDIGGAANRYSITDYAGNGYGLFLNYSSGQITVERRDLWIAKASQTSTAAIPGGALLGQWYTLRLQREGTQLSAELYNGKTDPLTATPLLQVKMDDAGHNGVTQININGGHDFDTGYIRVSEVTVSATLAISTTNLESATINSYYSKTLNTIGGTGPFTWSVINGTLPSGMNLDPAGLLSGTPLSAGYYTFTVEVVDINNNTDTQELSLTVKEPATALFEDDFSDGTITPWSQLKLGQIKMVSDPTAGWVLRKSGADDPNGGWSPLDISVGDFEFIAHTRKINTNGGAANRYSLTDSEGNGYGLYLNFNSSLLIIERRDSWTARAMQSSNTSLPGGAQLNQWYTLRLQRIGDLLTAEIYVGKADPLTASPVLQVTMTDATHQGLNQVNINGGNDFDTAYIRVTNSVNPVDLAIVTPTLTNARVGSAYSQTLSAIGGSGPYYWSELTGNLPNGMFLDSSGLLSGTPTVAGNYNLSFQVIDQNSTSVVTGLSLLVKDSSIAIFEDDFSDGLLAPWNQLQYGIIKMVNDPIDGWVLRKSGANDPHGGWASLEASVGDFELVTYTRRSNLTGGAANRYSLTDSSGNGYGLYLNYSSGQIKVERRDAWTARSTQTSSGSLPGGALLDQWYTLRLQRRGDLITAELYENKVDTASSSPILQVTLTDSTHSTFTQVNINGGYEYDTGYIVVR